MSGSGGRREQAVAEGADCGNRSPAGIERIHRAVDYVVAHLGDTLSLDTVAEVACYSPFHFHRVFKAVIGETLLEFVKRLRLERAVTLMIRRPELSLSEVAVECGFGSLSDFSRSFRRRYGVAPSRYDTEEHRRRHREQLIALMPEETDLPSRMRRLPPGTNPDDFEVALRELPPRTVLYRRVLKPFRPGAVDGAAREMVQWAESKGLANGQWLGSMLEDPEVVALDDCRYDVGLVVPEDVQPTDGLGRIDYPSMRVAEIDVRGPIDLEQRALDWLYGEWLPRSRHLPADLPCFEAWHGRPFGHGLEHFELAIQLPVVP